MEETFNNLRQFKIMQNPDKCTFAPPPPPRKLLGYIISKHGIQVNPDKISAINEIGLVRNVKDAQRLMGYLMTLSRFVSRLGECGLPSFHCMDEM
jgi:hypothetical protein